MSGLSKEEMHAGTHSEGVEDAVAYPDATNAGEPREMSKVEKRLVLKQDLVITPLLSGAFFFAYLVMPAHPL